MTGRQGRPRVVPQGQPEAHDPQKFGKHYEESPDSQYESPDVQGSQYQYKAQIPVNRRGGPSQQVGVNQQVEVDQKGMRVQEGYMDPYDQSVDQDGSSYEFEDSPYKFQVFPEDYDADEEEEDDGTV